jgi:hypothetical protein
MSNDEKELIELALSDQPIEATTMYDDFAKVINLRSGNDKVPTALLYDYFSLSYDEIEYRKFSVGMKKYASKVRDYSLINEALLNITLEQMKTAIVKAAYDKRKKIKTKTS